MKVRYQDKYSILEVSLNSSTHKVRFIDFNHEFSKYDTGLLCVLEAGHLSTVRINKILSYNPKLVWVTVSTGGFYSTGCTIFHKTCRPFRAFCSLAETLPNETEEVVKKSGMIVKEIFNKSDQSMLSILKPFSKDICPN